MRAGLRCSRAAGCLRERASHLMSPYEGASLASIDVIIDSHSCGARFLPKAMMNLLSTFRSALTSTVAGVTLAAILGTTSTEVLADESGDLSLDFTAALVSSYDVKTGVLVPRPSEER